MADNLAILLSSITPTTVLYPSDYDRMAAQARRYISQEIKAVRATRTDEYLAAGEFWTGRLAGMDASARIAELGLDAIANGLDNEPGT